MPLDVAQLSLPRWEVDLHGDARDLEHLTQHFTGDGLRIYKEDRTGQTLMVVEGFPVEANHAEVLTAATEKIKVLSGVLKVARQVQTPLSVGGVMLRQKNGTRRVYVSALETLGVSAEFHTEILRRDSNGRVIPVPQPVPLTVQLATLAQTDLVVAKAMRLAIAPDAETWTGLFRLYELIEGAAGGWRSLAGKDWISANQRARFRRTANSSASGDASRHGYGDCEPPANPMTLDEARAVVQMVMHAWIADRLAQSDTACNNSGNP